MGAFRAGLEVSNYRYCSCFTYTYGDFSLTEQGWIATVPGEAEDSGVSPGARSFISESWWQGP